MIEAYTPTEKQLLQRELIGSGAQDILAYGGSRSGKTFEFVRTLVYRALVAAQSNHAIFRYRFNHCKASIVYGTFPVVMQACFPQVRGKLDKSDWFYEFPNQSRIWFGGLDDKERTEKILGQEHATLMFNEISQMAYGSVMMAKTRLAQKVEYMLNGERRVLRMLAFYDCNPPPKSHWSYSYFFKMLDPEGGGKLEPATLAKIQMNPRDNQKNLPTEYIRTLEKLPPRLRIRFLEGLYADSLPGQLFSLEVIERNREDSAPDLVRVVVAVDPSGADDEDNAANDEIGILVVGLGTDGDAYVLEDCTVKAGPATWGRVAVEAYERHQADRLVAEINFGGAMVKHVIATAAREANAVVSFRMLTASRGKMVRAEPVSALAEQDRVHHVGTFTKLEEELCAFTTHGFMGSDSPNRGDAFVWAMSDLFPSLMKKETTEKQKAERRKLSMPTQEAWFPSTRV